jgi:hypothetical protein
MPKTPPQGFEHLMRFGLISDQLSAVSWPDIQFSKNARSNSAGRPMNGWLLCLANS